MTLIGAAIAILMVMGLVLVRALLGPTVYDRILAVNMFGTKTVLLIALMAFISGRLDILDIALAYALINFIGVIAVLRFFEYGDFSLNFETVFYVLSPNYNDYMDIRQAINLRIFEEFERRGIEFAYPTQTLFVEGASNGSESARQAR